VQDLVLLAWCTALVNVGRRGGALRTITRVWAASSICWAAILVLAWLLDIAPVLGRTAAEGTRVMFTFGDPNYAATYWVASIFVIGAAEYPLSPWLRRTGYLLLGWAIVLTQSNGALVELAVGAAVIVLVTVRRRHGLFAATAVLLLAASTMLVAIHFVPLGAVQTWARSSGQPLLVDSVGRSDASSSQRGILIEESLDLYAENVAFGSGPSTTKQLLYDRQYPYAKEAHNDYLAALVERGPAGMLGMTLLVLSAGWRAAAVVAGVVRGRRTAEVPHPEAVVAALLAFAVAAAYYEVLHFRFVWILLASVAVLAGPSAAASVRGSASEGSAP
jgi:hypothetical protein